MQKLIQKFFIILFLATPLVACENSSSLPIDEPEIENAADGIGSTDTPLGILDNYAELEGYVFEFTQYDKQNNPTIVYAYGGVVEIRSVNGHFTRTGDILSPTDASCLTTNISLRDAYTLDKYGNKVPVGEMLSQARMASIYGLSYIAEKPFDYSIPDEPLESAYVVRGEFESWKAYLHFTDTICTYGEAEISLEEFSGYSFLGGIQLTVYSYIPFIRGYNTPLSSIYYVARNRVIKEKGPHKRAFNFSYFFYKKNSYAPQGIAIG